MSRLAAPRAALNLVRSLRPITAVLVLLLLAGGAVLAPILSPRDADELASVSLMDSLKPPVGFPDADWAHPLGTDQQGRDMLSAILHGLRISLLVGACAMAIALTAGLLVGLLAGYVGGVLDAMLMRLADIQLTFPAILTSLLIDGILSAAAPPVLRGRLTLPIIIVSIGVSLWPGVARTVRGSTLVEREKDYIAAARLIGVPGWRIMLTHLLPNVIGPVLVIGTLGLGASILTEATLSFLGVGLPPTDPSLGTLIRIGNDYLFSGQWWIALLPGAVLVAFVLAVNLLGDWLRDALDPGHR